MHTQVIFFDLDHTLIDTRQQYLWGLSVALESLYGQDVPQDFIARFMQHNDELWPQYDKRLLSMKDLRRQRFLLTWGDYGFTRTDDEADEFQERYHETFETTLKCFPGTLEMLQVLAERYELGIITNGSPDLQEKKLKVTGLEPLFPHKNVIVSEAVGLAKPHPQVYDTACKRFDARPERCLMVGDNYKNDVLGARASGLRALWYGPDEVTTRDLPEAADLSGQERPLRTPHAVLEHISSTDKF